MSEHTKEPWFTDGEHIWRRHPKDLYQNGGGVAGDKPIATASKGWYGADESGYPVEANARRIVACVNACAGIDTETLEKYSVQQGLMIYLTSDLVKQRDELLAALKDASEEYKKLPHSLGYPLTHCNKWDELIAKVESEK